MAGHRGMVGSAITRQLTENADSELVTASRSDLDLTNQSTVRQYFHDENVDEVYLAAAKVGGIHANNEYPAEFIYENLAITLNVIEAAYSCGVKKLLFLGSSCIYPKNTDQPIKEEQLLTGPLELTNEPYAIAKIAGIKLCESFNRQYGVDYRSVMPTNLYGPNDNFHPENSHVIPAMMRRFHEAKELDKEYVAVWGTGTPRREFLHVDDMAAASIYLMDLPKSECSKVVNSGVSHVNVGVGMDCSIAELASVISGVVGYQGEIQFDLSKPDGTMRKLLDVSRLSSLGWQSKVTLQEGLRDTYAWYLENEASARK